MHPLMFSQLHTTAFSCCTGCGKTALTAELARLTGNLDMVRVHVDDQMDSKSLLGAYMCTSNPEEFVWQPGPLTQVGLPLPSFLMSTMCPGTGPSQHGIHRSHARVSLLCIGQASAKLFLLSAMCYLGCSNRMIQGLAKKSSSASCINSLPTCPP